MKRDMELVRKVLLATEENPDPIRWLNINMDGYTDDEISYHVKLLNDAGLLTAQNLTTHDGFCWKPKSLTWAGHEFLDTVQNDTVWRKTNGLRERKGRDNLNRNAQGGCDENRCFTFRDWVGARPCR